MSGPQRHGWVPGSMSGCYFVPTTSRSCSPLAELLAHGALARCRSVASACCHLLWVTTASCWSPLLSCLLCQNCGPARHSIHVLLCALTGTSLSERFKCYSHESIEPDSRALRDRPRCIQNPPLLRCRNLIFRSILLNFALGQIFSLKSVQFFMQLGFWKFCSKHICLDHHGGLSWDPAAHHCGLGGTELRGPGALRNWAYP